MREIPAIAAILFGFFVFAKIASFLVPILIGFAGAPGALIAGYSEKPLRRFLGFALCLLGQLYFTCWCASLGSGATGLFARQLGWWGLLLWPAGFLAAETPFYAISRDSLRSGETDPLVEVSVQHISVRLCTLAFPVLFIIFAVWPWLGYFLAPWAKHTP